LNQSCFRVTLVDSTSVCETENEKQEYSLAAGTHLRPGNTNVSVTHFINEGDDTFVYHLPDLFS